MPPDRRARLPRRPSTAVIRDFQDRGVQWLMEDPLNVRDLLSLYVPQLTQNLDFTQAVNVPRTTISPDLRRRHRDVIVRVPVTASAQRVFVLVLLEHQSKPDFVMPLRMLIYLIWLWDRQMRRWEEERVPESARRVDLVIPVVFYTGVSKWDEPLRVSNLVDGPSELKERFVPEMEIVRLSLHSLPAERLRQDNTAMSGFLRVLQKERAAYDELRRAYEESLQALELLPHDNVGQWLRANYYLQMLALHRRTSGEYTELESLIGRHASRSKFGLAQEIAAVGKTMVESIREEAEERGIRLGEERGIRLGEARGIEVGRLDGERRSLLRLLRARFGELPESVEASVMDAGAAVVDQWSQAAATAASLHEIGIRGRG